ncbi:MAG: hypothetical protein AMS27_08405 [Bacteroides sp. SM23_62_1]|nr:MAG: hypothetical protein AMS27_08405 [Bacteroides sp. SM23_62_1]
MKHVWILLFISIIFDACSENPNQKNKEAFPVLTGDYLGQELPDTIPRLFAPGIIGTGMYTRDVAISPDGNEFYYCVSIASYTYTAILYSKRVDGIWSKPEILPFCDQLDQLNFEPALSPDGQRLYFLSARPNGDEPAGNQDIWYAEKNGNSWSEPVNLGPPVNTEHAEYFPSLTTDGTLYFTRAERGSRENKIYRSKLIDGQYQEPELLPKQVNCGTNRFNAFIAQDESYIIVPAAGMENSYGDVDYFISFRDENDNWSDPVNMGPAINSIAQGEWSPFITPDGKYFFFMSNRTRDTLPAISDWQDLLRFHNQSQNGNSDIYWVSAGIIERLKNK